MDRQKLIWTVVFAVGALGLIINAVTRDAGSVYVKNVEHEFALVKDWKWVGTNTEVAKDYDLKGKETKIESIDHEFVLIDTNWIDIKSENAIGINLEDKETKIESIEHVFAKVFDEKWVDIKSDDALDYDIDVPENIIWSSTDNANAKDFIQYKLINTKKYLSEFIQKNNVNISDSLLNVISTRWVSNDESVSLFSIIQEVGYGKRNASLRQLIDDMENPHFRNEFLEQINNKNPFIFSFSRTLGIWVAAMFTLFIMSFLFKDNPFYKFAESVVVGVSAAYWMVVGFWDVIVPNLFGKLSPSFISSWAMPGLTGEADFWYLVPLVLGIMLLWRLAPSGTWISRWPLAFIIGTTAGIRLMGFIHADFLSQIRNSIIPLAVFENGSFLFWHSFLNLVLIIGVLTAIVYFFFSFEHKGVVGKTARVGIWFLMVTFGAAFGYTVMGRIALLAIRLEFLFDDWLWIIDPAMNRIAGM